MHSGVTDEGKITDAESKREEARKIQAREEMKEAERQWDPANRVHPDDLGGNVMRSETAPLDLAALKDAVVLDSKFSYKVDKLNDETANKTLISGYGNYCFEVNNVIMQGSIFVTPSICLLYKVEKFEDITVDSLKLLQYIKPMPDLLVIGTGLQIRYLPREVEAYLSSLNISVECVQTRNAVSTFNILNNEGRDLVGILLGVKMSEHEFTEEKSSIYVGPEKISV